MFKNKEKKKKTNNYRITATVDSKHQQKMKFFKQQKSNLPKLSRKLEEITRKLDELNTKEDFLLTDIAKKADLQKNKEDIELEIYNIYNNGWWWFNATRSLWCSRCILNWETRNYIF